VDVKKRLIIILFIVLLAGVSLIVYLAQLKGKNGEMFYSGTIEATSSNLAFQAAGRVSAVHAREGLAARQGEVLAELDASELQARFDQAASNLDRALRVQEQAEAALAIFRNNLPADVERAKAGLKVARDTHDEAQRNERRYESLYTQGVVALKERDAVKLAYENARSRLDEARSALDQAKGNLMKIDAARADLEAAKAQVKVASAALDQARIQLGYARLVAPYSGTITGRNVEPGEVVSVGREVITLADLSRVDLKIFVDETDIGRVRPGQQVEVKVDTFPDKVYQGMVSYISPEAEFTPKIIQTKKERVKLVYLVKVAIDNPHGELKTGMPADAYIR